MNVIYWCMQSQTRRLLQSHSARNVARYESVFVSSATSHRVYTSEHHLQTLRENSCSRLVLYQTGVSRENVQHATCGGITNVHRVNINIHKVRHAIFEKHFWDPPKNTFALRYTPTYYASIYFPPSLQTFPPPLQTSHMHVTPLNAFPDTPLVWRT